MLEIDFCLHCGEIPISCRILYVASFISFSFSWNRLGRADVFLQNGTCVSVSFSFS